jgi:SAM-dependent methyltransferase
MPAFAFTRQPDALPWFGSGRGAPLLAAEQAIVTRALASRSPQPWLWLAATPAELPAEAPVPRGVRLHVAGQPQELRFSGAVHCGLPLPLPTEAIGSIVVQHALDAGDAHALLDECARVLEPGGRLWLFTVNPFSPYRLRWRKAGLQPRDPAGWHERFRQVGLQPASETQYVGPIWRTSGAPGRHWPPPLRAVCLLEAEKRVAGLIPPAVAKRAWRAAAPA